LWVVVGLVFEVCGEALLKKLVLGGFGVFVGVGFMFFVVCLRVTFLVKPCLGVVVLLLWLFGLWGSTKAKFTNKEKELPLPVEITLTKTVEGQILAVWLEDCPEEISLVLGSGVHELTVEMRKAMHTYSTSKNGN